MSDAEVVALTISQKALNQRFIEQIQAVDEVAQIILKGHLVIDDVLTESIETLALHKELVGDARLQTSQKIALCRAFSTSDQNNRMWSLVSCINATRNALSHSLDPDRRAKALERLRGQYREHFGEVPKVGNDMPADTALCMYAIAAALGYLNAHLEEIRRLKSFILGIDATINGGALSG